MRSVIFLLGICAAAVAETAHNARVLRALAAKDEPALLSALGVRGHALGELLASRDVAAALELARGAPRARGTLSPAARALLQDEWASAVVEVTTLRGLPLPGATAAPHAVYLTFSGERRVRMHPASVAFAGLPPAGSVPVQGFFFNGSFVADRAGADCGEPAASGLVECVVGGEALAFASRAAAEVHVAMLRRAGSRGLQMGADPAIALPQPYFDANLTSGRRTAIFINVRFNGQSVSDSSIVPMNRLQLGAQALRELHGQRSFGKVEFTTAVVNCPLVLPFSAVYYDDPQDLMSDAITAAGISPSSCTPYTKSDILDFDHIVVFHPYIFCSDCAFDYAGLGSVRGKYTWYNGPDYANDFVITHEVGHNFGLNHAATWPANDAFVEYGDTTDVMGSSRPDQHPYNNGMAVGDYSAAAKIAMGWIPSSRYVALHPQGSNTATGLVSAASFPLAALDRNSVIGIDPFTAYPSTAALAARLTIPPHLTAIATKYGMNPFGRGSPVFAFISYRAMARLPGIYMNEMIYDVFGAGYPTLVCNEPLCREQAPLVGAYDAFLYDRNGTRALIEVGALTSAAIPATAGVTNTDLQNSAYQVTVSYLGANGRKLGAALGSGCIAATGLCGSDTFTPVTATGTFTATLSSFAPVALYRVTRSSFSSGAVTISACISGISPYSAPIGVSAFLSGFPTAHAFYTGSVGVSGDAVAPGFVPSYPYPQCASTTVTVANGLVVWLAVASPGSFRGSSLFVNVAITIGGIPLPVVGNFVSVEKNDIASCIDENVCNGGGFKQLSGLPFTCAFPCVDFDSPLYQFVLDSNFYLVRLNRAVWSSFPDYYLFTRQGIEGLSTVVDFKGQVLSSFLYPSEKMGACPKGSFKRNGVCVLCPIRGQSSTGYAITEQDCFCPTGFYPSSTGCVGQELGGPNAVSASVSAFPPCPLGKALSNGACVDCPVGSWPSPSTSYGAACNFKFYKVIEVVVSTTYSRSWMGGIFIRNSLGYGETMYTYTRFGVPGNTDTWVFYDGAWQLYDPQTNSITPVSFSSTSSVGALQLINSASLAFCDNVGDSTVDYLGRRVCYCGIGTQKDANNVCRACPSGQNRSVGGAASKVETCSSTASTLPSISAAQSASTDYVSWCLTLFRLCLSFFYIIYPPPPNHPTDIFHY